LQDLYKPGRLPETGYRFFREMQEKHAPLYTLMKRVGLADKGSLEMRDHGKSATAAELEWITAISAVFFALRFLTFFITVSSRIAAGMNGRNRRTYGLHRQSQYHESEYGAEPFQGSKGNGLGLKLHYGTVSRKGAKEAQRR
jgi:hypothetical protein